jgi:threonine/homoserine/homoserine lactone efflux protein
VSGDILMILKAALAGAAVSIPPGPAAAFVAAHARRHGRAAALGAALGDTCHGILAAAGLAAVGPAPRRAIALLAAVALAAAAVRALRRPSPAETGHPGPKAMFLALLAPGSLPAFLVLHAALGIGPGASLPLVAAGTLLGCALTWACLLLALRRVATRVVRYAVPVLLLLGLVGALGSALP